MQLSSIYATVGEDHKSLTVMEVAYGEGYLEESREIVRLAQLYLYHEIPLQGCEGAREGLRGRAGRGDRAELRSCSPTAGFVPRSSIRRSRLSGVPRICRRTAICTCASARSTWSPKTGVRPRAPSVLQIEKGELDRPGLANLLLGIAQFNERKYSAAKRSFRRASQFEKDPEVRAPVDTPRRSGARLASLLRKFARIPKGGHTICRFLWDPPRRERRAAGLSFECARRLLAPVRLRASRRRGLPTW